MPINLGTITASNNNFGVISNIDDVTNVARGAGVRPVGRIALAYAYEMRVGNKVVGLIRDITEDHRRDVTPVYELGTVGPVDLAPGQPSFTATGSATKVYTFNLLTTLYALALEDPNLAGAVNMPVIRELINASTRNVNLGGIAEQMLSVISGYPIPMDIAMVETRPTAFSPSGGPPITNIGQRSSITVYKEAWITRYGKRVNAEGRDAVVVENFEFSYRVPAVITHYSPSAT